MSFRNSNATVHLIRTFAVPDREDFTDTGIPGPPQHILTIRVKAWVIKMGVRVDEHLLQPGAIPHIFVKTDEDGLIFRSNGCSDDHAIRFQPS
jgi:hypothetical protein